MHIKTTPRDFGVPAPLVGHRANRDEMTKYGQAIMPSHERIQAHRVAVMDEFMYVLDRAESDAVFARAAQLVHMDDSFLEALERAAGELAAGVITPKPRPVR